MTEEDPNPNMLRKTNGTAEEGPAHQPPNGDAATSTVERPALSSNTKGISFSLDSTKMSAIAFVTAVATFFTVHLAGRVVADGESFYRQPFLYTGQYVALLCGFAVWTLAAMVYGLAAKDVLFGTEPSVTAAVRRYVDESQRSALNAAAEFTLLLALFFVCDRTNFFPRDSKKYNRDTFWFLWLALMIAALFTLRRAKPPAPHPPAPKSLPDSTAGIEIAVADEEAAVVDEGNFHVKWLQRDQTEEWKGWMQVMFLWYHYFEAKELYNVIRLYIAAYVWMTGFGNFSYYYIRKDFSLERFCQMQWRLNFLVLWVCLLLGNEYMLYYINMLHTYFTLLIYAGLGIASHWNTSAVGITVKFAVLGAFCYGMWDVSTQVFYTAWSLVAPLVQYHDPTNTSRHVLHEWFFRSWLDHYVWIIGMITAFNHPRVDRWMERVDSISNRTVSMAVKWGAAAVLLAATVWYTTSILLLPKAEYIAVHPYTSFIPITLYILARNLFPTLRRWHMHLFEYLGKITLETYIAQFHVWMVTTGINGPPKKLLRLLPFEGWPLVNFVVASALFFGVSMRLFHNTNVLKAFVLPPKSTPEVLRRNLLVAGAILAAVSVWALVLRTLALRMSS